MDRQSTAEERIQHRANLQVMRQERLSAAGQERLGAAAQLHAFSLGSADEPGIGVTDGAVGEEEGADGAPSPQFARTIEAAETPQRQEIFATPPLLCPPPGNPTIANATTELLSESSIEGGDHLDMAADGFSFEERILHFLRGQRINAKNRPVVEIAFVIECGTHISDLGPMRSEDKYNKMLERYTSLLTDMGDENWEDLAEKQKMKKKLYRAQAEHTGSRLWDKFLEFRSECRTLAAEMPTNLSSMPSGHQLNDIYSHYLQEKYRKIFVSTRLFIE